VTSLAGRPNHLNRSTAGLLRGATVKISEDAVVRTKATNLALRALSDGACDILGPWIESSERAKF
jgi:transposase-like protein